MHPKGGDQNSVASNTQIRTTIRKEHKHYTTVSEWTTYHQPKPHLREPNADEACTSRCRISTEYRAFGVRKDPR